MRILWILIAVVLVAVVGFGAFYFLGQRVDSGPTQADRAVAAAEKAVRERPNDIAARLNLGAAYVEANRQDDAESQFSEILKANKTNRDALIGLAALRYDKGDLAGAKDLYTKVIQASGTGEFAGADVLLQESYFFRGQIEMKQQDPTSALADFQKATTIDKADADAWYQLANAQMALGKAEDAIGSYQRALVFVPTGWCEPYDGIGKAFQAAKVPDGVAYASAMSAICKGDTSATHRQRLEALTSGGMKVPALLGLATTAESTGDMASALKWYRAVTQADPKNIAANTALSRLANENPHETTPTAPASQP